MCLIKSLKLLKKHDFFLQLAAEEEVREIRGTERILSTAGFEDGGNCMSRNGSDL